MYITLFIHFKERETMDLFIFWHMLAIVTVIGVSFTCGYVTRKVQEQQSNKHKLNRR